MIRPHLFAPLLLAFGVISQAHAVDEWSLSKPDVQKAILDNYDKGIDGNFAADHSTQLHAHVNEVPNEIGAVVLLQGRGENTVKYAELIYDLNRAGYSVYTYDHRGQGLSDGRLAEDYQKSNIDNYAYYVNDFRRFMDRVVGAKVHSHLFLLAQSMGGPIGIIGLSDTVRFDSIVLISPAFGFNTGHWDSTVRFAACGMFANGADYAKGKGPFNKDLQFSDDENHYTNSPNRFRLMRSLMMRDMNATVGGPTNNWVCQMMDAGAQAKNIRVETPIYVAKALQDSDARLADMDEFCNKQKNCTSGSFNGKHELLMEKDEVRDQLLHEIITRFQ